MRIIAKDLEIGAYLSLSLNPHPREPAKLRPIQPSILRQPAVCYGHHIMFYSEPSILFYSVLNVQMGRHT